MTTLTPPVKLEDPANQSRVEYVLDVSSSPDFDYPPVSLSLNHSYIINAILVIKQDKKKRNVRVHCEFMLVQNKRHNNE